LKRNEMITTEVT